MKKFYFILAVYSLLLTGNIKAQTNSIKVSSTGLVGINMATPSYQLDISGNVRMAYNGYTISFNGTTFLPSGNIDLGASGNRWYRLYSTSAFFTNQPVIDSDEKIKLNIENLPSIKDKLLLLRPVTYKLRTDIQGLQIDPLLNNTQYGFIAQELQKVFPEMVISKDDGTLGIRYNDLIPVLVQAIKEQQNEIDALTKRISVLEGTSK